MQRFFARPENIDEKNSLILIDGADVNHMRNVLRMKPGEEVWISDGAEKEYHCTIDSFDENEARLTILYAQVPSYELPSRIWLFQCLPKGDKMELVIQKAVELGVSAIVPVASNRCVVKLPPDKAQKKVQRWQQIAESASKQSRRMTIPKVYPVMAFPEALALGKSLDHFLMPYELQEGMSSAREILGRIKPGESIGVLIGPEGGFEKDEARRAEEAGASLISLGKRILRTETASLAMLSILMFQLESDEQK